MKTKLYLTTKSLGVSILILGLFLATGKNALAQAPVANFTCIAFTDWIAPDCIVNFTDISTNNPTSWFWDFGDGTFDTIQNPENLYYLPGGTYTVMLIASNNFGSDIIYGTVQSDQTGCISCILDKIGSISGKVFQDINANCLEDSSDFGLAGWIIRADPGGQDHAISNFLGSYQLYLDSGTYTISLIDNNYLWDQACPLAPSFYTIVLDNDTIINNINFGLQAVAFCPDLIIDISTWAIRPCFSSHYSVSYCNHGTVASTNATIEVELDNNMTYTSGTGNLISQIGNLLTFGIGTANPGQCGSFYFNVDITCDMNLLGSTMCVEAHIYPDSNCFPSDSAWDHSSMAVVGSCVNDSLACFTIYNTGDPGTGDMQGTAEYRIYENNMLVSTGTFQFAGGDSLVVCWPANGNTIRLEADQRPGHPGNSNPHDNVELCGGPPFITGLITQVPEDDQDDFIEIDCREVTGSYDPNEKQVKPRGLTDISHFIDSTDILEYVIHFQNVGNDTAFKIVIKDTLSTYLDITTIEPGASSHPYSLDIFGSDILQWTFDNIMLPDSGKDEPASNGFVKFKIQQKPGNAIGTVIENNAGIIFDFNLPVITNMVFNTVGNIDSITKAVDFHPEDSGSMPNFQLKVYPNPFNKTTTFEIKGVDKNIPISFELYNIAGKQVKEISNIKGSKFVISMKNLPDGIYIYKIHAGDGMIGAGKLVVY